MMDGEVNKVLRMKLKPWVGWVTAIIIIVTILCILSVAIPQILGARRSYWAPRAKSTLRAYGKTQEAYKEANPRGTYASWDDLVKYEWVEEGYTRGNIIENYSVWTNTEDNEFIVIAFPRKTYPPGYLSTFAIREDQILREYQPEPEMTEWDDDVDCVFTWEPIR